MNNSCEKLFPVAKVITELKKALPWLQKYEVIYQSTGLKHHIIKRHPDCIQYIDKIKDILENPSYIGSSPKEAGKSFEVVTTLEENFQVCVKLDLSKNYLFVSTFYMITNAKLKHRIKSGRFIELIDKKID